jgi:hypothetical protein
MDNVTYYFPLTCTLWELDEACGGSSVDGERIDGRGAVWHKDAILGQVKKENGYFGTSRMLAEYLDEGSALRDKVRGMTPTVEEHGGRLWGAMVMELDGNVFNLIGLVSRTLKRAGMPDAAKEMCVRAMSGGSYGEALGVIMEYVEPADAGEHQQRGMEMRM